MRATPHRCALVATGLALLHAVGMAAGSTATADNSFAALSRLSIEELAQIEISSVSRRAEPLADAPAAVYVITRAQIRHAGAATLPEALRLAPNLQVARVNASSYAISARGFNSVSANKLLVMIDGRTVYTPLHSGVFWDVQDLSVGDIDHIEVVSGPGGALWGANAVNGVINVVTRSASEATDTSVSPAFGTAERGIGVRHGMRLGEQAAARLYARTFEVDPTERADGTPAADGSRHKQAGLRADWSADRSHWTLQGDVYEGRAQVPNQSDRDVAGGNVLARWSRDLGTRGNVRVQAYFDTYSRRQPGFFSEDLDTVDLDVQHQMAWGAQHELVWGGGLRHHHDRTRGGALLGFVPADSRLKLASVFAQDTVAVGPRVELTLGMKAERNDYTGTEYQPNVRLAYKPDDGALLWAAVSRAVRTPSRLDRDFRVFVDLPAPYNGKLLGGADFVSEQVSAYEVGYRAQPSQRLSFSVNAFYNDYRRLRSIEPTGTGNELAIGNGVRGHSSGMEAWGSWQIHDAWQVDAGLSLLHQSLSFAPGSRDPGAPGVGGNDPEYQWSLRSTWSLPRDLSFDLGLRSVGALPAPPVPAYTALDARLAWTPRPNLELSIAAFNLLDEAHAEFGAAPQRSEFGPRLLLRAIWRL